MGIILALIVGLFVGVVAKLLMPGKDPGGFIITALLGIAGSATAMFLGRAMGWYEDGSAPGFIASVIGAMLLLFAYRMIRGRRD